jgi:hypothetical protein
MAKTVVTCPVCGQDFKQVNEGQRRCSIRCRDLAKTVPPEQRFERFFERGSNSDCWLWRGGTTSHGYAVFQIARGKSMMAYRFMWETLYGEIDEGLFVCHRCDNPLCVNPAHLFLGTHQDNRTDMVAKSRQTSGERNPQAKLTESDVLAMRAERRGGAALTTLAKKYGVAHMTAHYICKGKRWKHLPV